MILENLSAGAAVTLEVQWGESKYEIATNVEQVQKDSILIKPFLYKGTVLDLSSNQFRDMIYHLYALDPATGSRFVWKNISVETKILHDEHFYEIRVNTFGRYGMVSDRRDNVRIPIGVRGTVCIGQSEDKTIAEIYDISNEGISFVTSNYIETAGRNLLVEFEDRVQEHYFQIKLECICVRQVQQKKGYLYGCRVVNAGKNTLAYACLKRMKKQADNRIVLDEKSE